MPILLLASPAVYFISRRVVGTSIKTRQLHGSIECRTAPPFRTNAGMERHPHLSSVDLHQWWALADNALLQIHSADEYAYRRWTTEFVQNIPPKRCHMNRRVELT